MTTRDAAVLAADVVVGDVGVEEHLVAEAGASAGAHGDPQHELVGVALGLDEALHLVGGGVGEVKTVLASVTVNIDMRVGLSVGRLTTSGYPSRHGDVARLRVVQRRELLDASPADRIDHALAEPAVQVADELRVRLGELAERAVQELDADRALGGAVAGLDARARSRAGRARGSSAREAAAGPGAAAGLGTPLLAGVGGVVGVGADALGERAEQPGEQRVRGRVEAERRARPAARK